MVGDLVDVTLAGDDTRRIGDGVRGDSDFTGEEDGRPGDDNRCRSRTGLVVGDSASASMLHDVSAILPGVDARFGVL